MSLRKIGLRITWLKRYVKPPPIANAAGNLNSLLLKIFALLTSNLLLIIENSANDIQFSILCYILI
jgi:hypothetical protein